MKFGINLFYGRYLDSWTNPFDLKRETCSDVLAILAIDLFRLIALPVEIFIYWNVEHIITYQDSKGELYASDPRNPEKSLESGLTGSVTQCKFTSWSGKTKTKAVKKLTHAFEYEQQKRRRIVFEREGYFHQLTKHIPHVAGGGKLVKKNEQTYIVMDLYENDALNFQSKDYTSIFKSVMKTCVGLEERDLFPFDVKPENILIKKNAFYAADLAGIAFLPPFKDLRQHLDKQRELINNVTTLDHPPSFYKTIDTMSDVEVIKTFYYCNASTYYILGTKYYSNTALLYQINTFHDLPILEDQAEKRYEELKSNIRKLMIYECAKTSLALCDHDSRELEGVELEQRAKRLLSPTLNKIFQGMIDLNERHPLSYYYKQVCSI